MSDNELLHRFEQARTHYHRTIRTFARGSLWQHPNDVDIDDLVQELEVVLWRCVKNYDPDRGASFNVLFQGSARNHLISMARRNNTQSRKTTLVHLDQEDVAAAVESVYRDWSAEDYYLAAEEVRARLVA